MSTSKRTALITGGSRGLGFAIAKRLARENYRLVLIARNQDRLNEAKAELEADGAETIIFASDVTDPAKIETIAAEVKDRFGSIEFLILNAGISHYQSLADFTDNAELRADLDVDLWGTVLCTKVFLPLLSRGSKLLLVSSGMGFFGIAGATTYCAAKAGINNFGECLRREVRANGIAVYCACPAEIDTYMYRHELDTMPDWMKAGRQPGNVMTAEVAADRIIRKCKGNRYYIIINFDVHLLRFCQRLLPARVLDFVLDQMFPIPN